MLLLTLAALGCGGLAQARATDVYAVVGTLGYDLQRDVLPVVDVAVGAQCLYQELDIGDLIELVEQGVDATAVAPGGYEAAVLEAGDGECAGTPLVTGRADVPAAPLPEQGAANVAALVVAALDGNGGPKLRTFNLNTAALGARRSRLTFFHSAHAPALDLRLRRVGQRGNALVATGLDNGAQTFPAELFGTDYELLVSPASTTPGGFLRPVATFELPLEGDRSHAAVLIGSLERGTFDLVVLRAVTAP